MLLGTIPWYLMYAASYESMSTILNRSSSLGNTTTANNKDRNSGLKHGLCVVPALIGSSFFRVPGDAIRHKIQIRQKSCKNVADCVQKIWTRQGGAKGFYRGIGPTMMRDVLEQYICFTLYEQLRTRIITSMQKKKAAKMATMAASAKAEATTTLTSTPPPTIPSTTAKRGGDREKLGTGVHLFCGVLSGAFASWLTAPLDAVKTRLQVSKSRNLGQVLAHVRTHGGFRSLWQGTTPRVFQQALLYSSYFVLYEWLKLILKPESEREHGDRDVFHKMFAKKRTKIISRLNIPV